ncbi:PP2C family protein-serine/threonine phosphatase [Parachitinimonas caeni]|uniref:PP2C family protein-serine/threonine phosphatase n=1 Tax=Parachitinimonas caeni TaxID=3031301 RepID=A0ABT7DVJ0_9NEIS|nr:PP2C family protein-serine/threonine phosphatase [Parachitinimonas caeni]MDK2124082.1 PP2C family protein-serine/threonine phosphatase [Parachitinimonas caeni]
MLRTRLTLLVLAALIVLISGQILMLWQRDQRFEARYADSLKLSQDIAWNKIQARQLQLLQEHADRLLGNRDLASALTSQDRNKASQVFDAYSADNPGLRIDAYTPRHALLYSSSADLDQRSLLDAGGLAGLLNSNRPLSGISQLDAQRYQLLVAQPLHQQSATVAVIALGFPINEALSELKQNLASEAYMMNLRGRVTHGTNLTLWKEVGASPNPRAVNVQRITRGDIVHLAVTLPVKNPEGRIIGALVTLRDISRANADDRLFTLVWAGIGLTMAALVTFGLFLYIRRSLQPLSRAVVVLDSLARGETNARLPDSDEELQGEAGDMARAVGVLREELVKLEMLREERSRQRWRQERLIREQLLALAVNLNDEARDKVLRDLDQALSAASSQDGNQLSALAEILGRLSALINAQQSRLLQLVYELQQAMETKARLASLTQELEIARRMQLSILPRAFSPREEVGIAATMIPAKEVGGDFYDYFLLDDTHLGVVVADVSGKGVPAAFFMAISRTMLKTHARFLRSPAACLAKLNELLAAENEQMMFVTAFYGVLDLVTGEFAFANAGHNPPLLQNRQGELEWLPQTGGIALAVLDNADYAETAIRLQPGDTLLMFTDGVTEAIDQQEALFGEARLAHTLQAIGPNSPISSVPSGVVEAIREFAQGASQADDITCVALRFHPAAQTSAQNAEVLLT